MTTTEHLSALPAGYRLHEYEIVSLLGVGGFGITYLANDTQLGMRVAIKEYLPNALAVRAENSTVLPKSNIDAESYRWGLDRFLTEAQTLARFRHPNIVRVLRFFEANGTGYTVMEYEEGQNLVEYLRTHPVALREPEILKLLLPLLDGLKLVHAAGFLHRDIKPANIYLRSDGAAVLIDFGSARQAMGSHTQNLTSVFSPGYAPFEQYFADGRQGPWTDIYALGAVLYRLATGEPPPDAAKRIREDPLIPASIRAKGRYSAGFLHAIDQALLMNDEARPQTIDAWLNMLASTQVPTSMPFNPPSRAVGAPAATITAGSQGTVHATASASTVPPRTAARIRSQPPPPKSGPLKAIILVVLILAVGVGLLKHFHQHKAHAIAAATATSQTAAPQATPNPAPATAPTHLPPAAQPVRQIPPPSVDNLDQTANTAPSNTTIARDRGEQGSNARPAPPPMRSTRNGQNPFDQRFSRADTNGDGYLSRSETAAAFPRLSRDFDLVDTNHDGQLSKEELRQFTERALGLRRPLTGRRKRFQNLAQ